MDLLQIHSMRDGSNFELLESSYQSISCFGKWLLNIFREFCIRLDDAASLWSTLEHE